MPPESMPLESMAAEPSDEQLACRAQGGCSASFEELVRRYQVPLLQFLRRRTTAADAEDLVQDTLIRAYENLKRYCPKWRFCTWLFTIARRLNINQQRRRRPAADSEILESVPSGTLQPVQWVGEQESRRRLWDRAAEVLNEGQMTAVWLYYVEDLSVKEIAMVEGRSRAAVKTMLFRARKKLLPALEDWKPRGAVKDRNLPSKKPSNPEAAEVPHG